MTMAQVLEAIRALGERFEAQDERLVALEDTRDADADGGGEVADADADGGGDAAGADAGADAGGDAAGEGRMDDDDKDDEKDDDDDRQAGGSTGRAAAAGGQAATMTRAETRRAAREKDKKARSGNYGNIGINPNLGPSRNKVGDAGMTVGNMMRSALSGGVHKEGYRELEYLEERHVQHGRDGLVVPWDFLATYGRNAEKIERKFEKDGWEPKRINAGYVEEKYEVMGPDGHLRTITSTNASGIIGVDLDISRSQMWLHEVSPVLGYMNPVMGVNSEYQIWYGNVAPTGSEVPEGGAHTENTPSLTRLRRSPVLIHMPWSLTGTMLAQDAVGMGALFENAVEGPFMELIIKAMLSGKATGADFAANANSFDGLFASGGAATTFGATANTSITAFARTVVTDAESAMRTNNAMGEGMFWILGTPMIAAAVNARVGGNQAIVFLAQRSVDGFREGLIGGTTLGLGTKYVESNLLGRATTKAYARSAVGVLGFGSQMVPIFFGQGIEFRVVRLTNTTNTNYSFQTAVNFALVNPNNIQKIAQML